MSMNIPIFFHMYKYKNKLYVDGGVMNTLPFDRYDNGETDILTISLGETYIDPQKSLLNYLMKVVKLLTNKESAKVLERKTDRNKIIIISIKVNKYLFASPQTLNQQFQISRKLHNCHRL